MNRKALIAAALLVAAGLGGWALVSIPSVQDWLVSEGVDRTVKQRAFAHDGKDKLQVLICGTSPPPPSRTRAKTCTLVMAGNFAFVVDTGPGSANNLSLWRFPMGTLSGVLLTHFHSDHIGDLGEFRMLSWVAGRTAPLPVYGPDGVDKIVSGFNLAYAADDSYRASEHNLSLAAANLVAQPFGLASDVDRPSHMGSKVIFDKDGLRITAFQVEHEPVYPAVGYRFDYRGRSVVISGDTVASPNLLKHAHGADLLVHEGQSEVARRIMVDALKRAGDLHLAKVIGEVGNYHATPVQAARIAREAGVKLLVFDHMGPIPPDNYVTRQLFSRGVNHELNSDRWTLANDGMIFTMPSESDEILKYSIK